HSADAALSAKPDSRCRTTASSFCNAHSMNRKNFLTNDESQSRTRKPINHNRTMHLVFHGRVHEPALKHCEAARRLLFRREQTRKILHRTQNPERSQDTILIRAQ